MCITPQQNIFSLICLFVLRRSYLNTLRRLLNLDGFIRVQNVHPRDKTKPLPHDSQFTIKGITGTVFTFKELELTHSKTVETFVSGDITVMQDDVILFKEGEYVTPPNTVYTIKSEFMHLIVSRNAVSNSSTYFNGKPQQKKKLRPEKVNYTISIQKKHIKSGSGKATEFLIQTVDGKTFAFTKKKNLRHGLT